jgi:hypothetical protein
MMRLPSIPRVLAVLALAASATACGDSATEPGIPDVNPALLENDGFGSISSQSAQSLPQGSASFTGPGGMAMDATADEFIQQLTMEDGTVLKTSGISIRAVPDESVTDAPFDRIVFGSALTGSHASVGVGTYTIDSPLPFIDFVEVVPVTHGAVILEAGSGRETARADEGVVTLTSLEYFDDVYPCEDQGNDVIVYQSCEYQIGLLTGSVEFTAETSSGEVVQQHEEFELPIQKRTLFAEYHPGS